MSLRLETGFSLITMLIILTAVSLISAHLLSQAFLITKITTGFQHQWKKAQTIENNLLKKEDEVLKSIEKYPEKIEAFIPDHLEFGCRQGVSVLRITAPPLESMWVIPK